MAFISLGIIIFSQLRGARRSAFRLVEVLPILAWFGLIHGGHELLVMFDTIKGEPYFLKVFSAFLLALSYLLLLFFGYSLFNLDERKKLGAWVPLIAILLFFSVPAFSWPQSLSTWIMSSRYFLGFVGAVLSAIGLQRYYHADGMQMHRIGVGPYFSAASASFILYALAGGLIVPKGSFFPAAVLNESSFLSLLGMPVLVFRAIAAVGLSWSFWHIINFFNIEQQDPRERQEAELRAAHDTLEERVKQRTDEVTKVNWQLEEEVGRRKEVEGTLRSISDTLQEALLEVPENVPGVDFGHLYKSSTSEPGKAGGDFYDLFELEHENVGIIIGDVSGKGLEAATLTSLVKHSIQAYAYEISSPAEVISSTNNVVCRSLSSSAFVTVFFGILDMRSGILTYCSAGHPPGIIRRITGETSALKTRSPIIGVFPSASFTDEQIVMRHDDMLLLFTDGVIEARLDGELYGEERLVEFVRDSGTTDTKVLPQRILEEVSHFCEGSLSDDLAILAISFRGTCRADQSEPAKY